jgi:PAS domain S-box-containing protein
MPQRNPTPPPQAAEALLRFRAALDASGDAIVLIDRATLRYLDFNQTFCDMLGYAREELVGMTPMHVFSADRATLERDYDAIIADQDCPASKVEGQYRRKDGTVFPIETRRRALRAEGGWVIVANARDISERKRAEQAMREFTTVLERRVAERTAELEQSNQELESFSYSVAHDLRAPVRAIAAFAAIVREKFPGEVPAEARGYLERVEKNAVQMGRLIDDLLELSRTGRTALVRTRVDMRALAADVARELQQETGSQTPVSVGQMPPVEGDVKLLRQAWRNLIENALKFSHKAAAPRVEAGFGGSDIGPAYFVRDNGAGFDMTYAEKLFGVFQRLHTPAEFEGTGVGLAIVKRIVQRHGGRLSAESTLGQGATFRFNIASQGSA